MQTFDFKAKLLSRECQELSRFFCFFSFLFFFLSFFFVIILIAISNQMFALQMFNAAELQMLISGEDGPLDLEAWARATHYAGGYHPSQPVIRDFWSVVKEFTPQQQRKLLRFITSSSRAPLLGFESFYPPITISKRDGGDEYLPTAATCVNLLKVLVLVFFFQIVFFYSMFLF